MIATIRLVPGLALVAFLAAACGGAKDEGGPAAPPPIVASGSERAAPSAPEPEPAPATAAASPAAPAPGSEATAAQQEPPPEPVPAAPEAPPAAPAAAPPDPLKAIAVEEEVATRRATDLAAAEKDLAEKDARVAELEKRLLAVKNPFLPRPQLPPDEEAAWKGLDGVGRAKRVEEQLVTARADAAAARAKVDALRRNAP